MKKEKNLPIAYKANQQLLRETKHTPSSLQTKTRQKSQNVLNLSQRKIAIYCRVSTRDQAVNGFGLEAQQRQIILFLLNKEINPDDCIWFIERGKSARNLERPEFDKLLRLVEAGEIYKIVFYKLDRVVRSIEDFSYILRLLKRNQCELESVMDSIDIKKANGRFGVNVLASVAQLESETTSERTLDGMFVSAQDGNYMFGGRPPFGYTRNGNKLLIHEENARIVKYIFDLAKSGHGDKFISKKMLLEKHMRFSHHRIRGIIINKIYIGKLVWADNEFDCSITPIIDSVVYHHILELRSQRNTFYVNDYIFKKIVYCTCGRRCEAQVTVKPQKSYFYYYCHRCKKRMNEAKILGQLAYDFIDVLKKRDVDTEKQLLIKQQKNIDKKMSAHYERYLVDEISSDLYFKIMNTLADEKKKIDKKLLPLYENVKVRWELMDRSQKFEFVVEHFKRIVIDMNLKLVVQIERW